jgi:hypothetical protein
MTTDDNPVAIGNGEDEKAVFTGEENTEERSTPKKDLAAAIFIAVLSFVAMYYAWRLEVVDSFSPHRACCRS